MTQEKPDGKIFNDSIHGHIVLRPLLVRIIDTPQFQRLRNIKQLGGAYFVYPGASHNRFEHSIGVGYLGGEFVKSLQSRQPELNIDDRDILCVEIAGLCHDLGHGPFSHLYDRMFIPKACRGIKWKHENASIKMFDHLVEVNKLEEMSDDKDGQSLKEDRVFIKELILGHPLESPELNTSSTPWPYKGRNEEKSFLYEIVANKLNGIDVDKFDYFARDCHHLGMKNNFDHRRLFKFARVCEYNKRRHICFRDKEVGNLYDMFYTRNLLHRRAYQHKVNKNIEIMITDALLKADPYIKIQGSDKKKFTLSKAIHDMEAYTKLTDQVLEKITNPDFEEQKEAMKDANKIVQRIFSRKLYKFLGEAKKQEEQPGKQMEVKIPEATTESLKEKLREGEGRPDQEIFEVVVVTLDYGMKDKDPIKNTYFYKKSDHKIAFTLSRDKVSKLLPERFSEQIIRVYWKSDEGSSEAKKRYMSWCEDNGFKHDQ
ncbi:deoxynucleoside triphosphate triphosphohydrolase SAMHD1-like isoform X2 [Melanotaenia boesemani]|uniref:deoxynucleoside triphosphate triphosphohydrolase SAMHD1-like isoform X2 n=1 Tax=Melanotaenia boesemani TaxID=1250792 RepID=UPI001C05D159|nr:deoxynucleoside triphosphate triphosphohydrolase SAMHD1-like isoform X2 [Melanotaenia boesemani]